MTKHGTWLLAAVLACGVAGPTANVAAQTGLVTPIFTGFWQHQALDEMEPLPWQPGPTRHVNGALDRQNVHVVFQGDPTNPNLRPWAAAHVKKISDEAARLDAAGQVIITDNPQESCRLSGVPNIIQLPGPMQVLQGADQVTIIHQRDHQVRRIYLNRPHSQNLKPTPYGESVGWYEGDTLVIDTVGLTAHGPIDMFSTPHTEQLHVVERMRLVDNGTRIEVMVRIEDPGTFYRPFNTRMYYNRSNVAEFAEEICAENNRLPTNGAYDIPMARADEPRY